MEVDVKQLSVRSITVIVMLLLIPTGCKRSQGPGDALAGGPDSMRASHPSARSGKRIIRSLIREASRAELWDRGLFINLGTPDQHKYIQGGWRTGWGEAVSKGGFFLNAKKRARLSFHDWAGGTRGIMLRARSLTDRQQLVLRLDGRPIGSRKLKQDWSVLDFALKQPLAPGRRSLELRFGRGSSEDSVAQVDWIWLRNLEGTPPNPVKTATRVHGSPRRSLVADPPRTFSYYLEVPPRAGLVLDYAGSPGTDFQVQATLDQSTPEELFSSRAEKEVWKEASMDLSALSGKVVRLDLVTRGAPGTRASWAEPDLVGSGKRARPPVVTPAKRARNLLHVVIDTARRDVYRTYNPSTHVKAPAMARLASESTIFASAYANSNWTVPSIATIWSGLYPTTHQTKYKHSKLPQDVPVLSEHLRANGLETAAFIANGYTSGKFGFKRGWDTYRNYIRQALPYKAEHVYADALAWLQQHKDQRFFLYIQTIDPHVPYEAPPKYRKLYFDLDYRGILGPTVTGYETSDFNGGKKEFSAEDRRYTRALYDGEITYHDHHFGAFMEQVRELGLMDTTMIVVSNDHGEELLDHGKYGHGHSLYEELIQCPLFVRYPPLFPAGKIVHDVVELVDLLPTQLEVLGVPRLHDIEGLSLLGAVHGQRAMTPPYAISEFLENERSVKVGAHKQIISRGGGGQLFNLRDDPRESDDLSETHPVTRRACDVHLGEGLAVQSKTRRLLVMTQRRRFRGQQALIDDELRRQLRALGYLQ